MANKPIDLLQLFSGLQNQMEAYLNTNRSNINHPGTKGDALENVWIDWLRKYLPNRYNVDKAIVIDSFGSVSDQIDLVIYDQQYTPFVFTQNGVHYIPAEGVYAVFEVKPDLKGTVEVDKKSISHIEYAGRKIESVRLLKRTSANIIDRGELRKPRPLTKIIGGILSSVNTIAKETTIQKQLSNLSGLQTLDMGCSVESGAFYVDYEGQENKTILDHNGRIDDYYNNRNVESVVFSDRNNSMISFFLQLSRYLQQGIGTVAAIDFDAYSAQIGVKIDLVI